MYTQRMKRSIILLTLFLFYSAQTSADDTEIYFGSGYEPSDPKVLVLFDTSGSMSNGIPNRDSNTESRMSVAKKVLLDVVHDSDNAKVDFGLMLFNYNGSGDYDGGRIVFKIQDIIPSVLGAEPDSYTVQAHTNAYGTDNGGICQWNTGNEPADTTLTKKICAMRPDGSTPLAESFYEAYLYFTGANVKFGLENGADDGGDAYTSRPRDLTAESGSPTNYISPVLEDNYGIEYDTDDDGDTDTDDLQCEQSYIVMMTDGIPTSDTNANTSINSLVGGSCTGNGNCMEDLAGYMYTEDLGVDPGDSSHASYVDDMQQIVSHMIGFTTDQDLLEDTASAGGGQYFTTNNATGLADAFKSIFADINAASVTFTSPGVGTSTVSESRSLDYIYFSQFTPGETAKWDGNIKKYRITEDVTDLDGDGDKTHKIIVDDNGALVVDSVTGAYNTNIKSIWTTDVTYDNDDIIKGGAGASFVGHASRTIYTNTGSGSYNLSTQPFNDTNVGLTTTLLNTADATETANLINWVRGREYDDVGGSEDLTIDRSWRMGDPLHSSPVVINYGQREGVAQYVGDFSDLRLVVGTNGGMLHMFKDDLGGSGNTCSNGIFPTTDTSHPAFKRCKNVSVVVDGNNVIVPGYTTGDTVSESWAFVPKEIAGIFKTLKNNAPGVSHPYGIDGDITIFKNDNNNDGNICTSSTCANLSGVGNDQVIIVFGLRRGGGSYYAIDVSNPNNPEFLWQFTDSEMLQSWSQPQVGYVNVSGTKTAVAIFAAGYDTNKDSATNNGTVPLGTNDTKGRGLYIVNIQTGALVWSLLGDPDSNSGTAIPARSATALYTDDFKDSMPARVSAIDIDGDEVIDRLYMPDTGGNIWRVDLYSDNRNHWNVHQIASLGRHTGTATVHTDRRFFNTIDVVQTRQGEQNFDALLLGSGHRTNPLETQTNNNFYMIKDTDTANYKFQSGACATSGTPAVQTDPACRTNPGVKVHGDGTGSGNGLYDVTSTTVSSSTNGWRLGLGSTEETRQKVLGQSTTIQGITLFTAFNGHQPDNDTCTIANGVNSFYALKLHSADGAFDTDEDGDIDTDDRYTPTGVQGLLADIPVHVDDDGDISGILGARPPVDFDVKTYTKAFFWFNSNE